MYAASLLNSMPSPTISPSFENEPLHTLLGRCSGRCHKLFLEEIWIILISSFEKQQKWAILREINILEDNFALKIVLLCHLVCLKNKRSEQTFF